MEPNNETKVILSDQALENIHSYASTLKRILERLYAEGYVIKDGQIVPVDHPPNQGIEIIIEW